uniref:CCHC-type domain-containing protein n=1 Tax=Magallana gigas TaxID=29159 RepID=A0A8W8JIT7_MAGGI
MSDSEKNNSHHSSGRNINPEQTRAIDEEQFDATDAVCLFNRRIESALEKQRVAIVSEIHEKFQSKSSESCVLRAEDKHGWDTVKEYTDSDLADNSEDATKLRSAISRATAKKRRYNPYSYDNKDYQSAKPGIFDGLTPRQLFRENSGFQQYNQRFNRPNTTYFRGTYKVPGNNVICLYCQLPGHFAKFCPYTNQKQRGRPATAPESTVTDTRKQ